MSKCKKVKNPCKICLQPVTQKTGLQCQGACQSWVHYSCLHYTPGKIRDIKQGIIKITCPCPDCRTTLPKEFRTDEPFSCTNLRCPANQPPKCDNMTCPSNSDPPHKINQTPYTSPPLAQCGNECQKHGMTMGNATAQYSNQGSSSSGCASGCDSSGDVSGDQRRGGGKDFPSLQAVEQMCNTVGQLTTQINDLMCKMKQAVQEQGGGGGAGAHKQQPKQNSCPHKGPKSQCPKPCYCPGNPARRK